MISPRARILYLLAISVVCFVVRQPSVLAGLLAFHLGLWAYLRLPLASLVRIVRKLSFFIVLILVTFALIPTEALQGDTWTQIPIFGWNLSLNLTGLAIGVLMALRVLVVVVASMAVQLSGQPGEFVAGLRAIRMPEIAALTIDSTLHLLGPGGAGGRGMGRGQGGGRGRHQAAEATNSDSPKELTWRRILAGDFSFLINMVESALGRAQAYLRGTNPDADPRMIHDVAIISGLSLLMMTAKLLKVLPGVPFAPGHKLVILVPLYILAAELTHSRFGSTITGTTVGVVAFLFGDGRFGVFEILKHITPGLVVDLSLPLLKRINPEPSRVTLIVIGAVCAAVRTATIVAVTLLIEAPPLFYVLIVPMVISQSVFGGISGFVTFYLLRYLERFRQVLSAGAATDPAAAAEASPSSLQVPVAVGDPQDGISASGRMAADADSGSGRGRGAGGGNGRGRNRAAADPPDRVASLRNGHERDASAIDSIRAGDQPGPP